jgi:MFS family permease
VCADVEKEETERMNAGVPAMTTAATLTRSDTPGYRAWVLFVLIVVYTFNFIDRQIVSILAGPIKAELHLSDTQLGLMVGLAFGLFYATLAVPIAWLADRYSRVWIMTLSFGVWSLFTAGCGLASNFWQLFLSRLGVGIGEAGGVAPAYSLIADYFPRGSRARAMALYSCAIPIGSALGVLFGGLVASAVNWRVAFLVVGLAGVVLAPVFRLAVRDPVRGAFDGVAPEAAAPFGEVLRLLARKPAFWLLAFGASSGSLLGYGLIAWLPSFFERSFGMTLQERAVFYAGILLIGGVGGIWLGGWLADFLGSRKKSAYAVIPACAALLSAPCFLLAILSTTKWMAFALFVVPQALSLVWLGPVIAAVQQLVPPTMRSTASAIFLLINNLIGLGVGPVFFGRVSDLLRPYYGTESLRYAIVIGLGFYVLSAFFFWLASRRLERDWH